MFDWQWGYTVQILPRLLEATLNTLKAVGMGYGIALLLGLPLALLQRTSSRALTRVVREGMEFVRSTPLVLQIFFVFYVGPQFGLRLSPWTSGMIAIGLHYAAYLSEVFRAGLDAVPRGQWEACRALNLGPYRTYMRIVVPQAVPICLPGMGNYLVGILKDTPMLSVIGVAELMHTANALGAENYRFLEPYTLIGIIFLALSLPAAAFFRFLEAWVKRHLNMSR